MQTIEKIGATFTTVFNKMVEAYQPIQATAALGSGVALQTTGIIVLIGTFSTKVIAILSTSVHLMEVSFSSVDFGIAVASGILLMGGGSAIRVWERVLWERSNAHRSEYNVEAMGKAADLAIQAADKAANLSVRAAERAADLLLHQGDSSRPQPVSAAPAPPPA